jgi:EmrB/QacA subfamily drug resistance transporter
MPEPTRTGLTPEDDQRWPALLIATLSSFLTPFMLSAVNIALPAIGRHFGADAVLLSWVATAYLLAASVSLMPFGKLSDLHGRKRVFLVGMTVFTASSVLCGLAGSVEALIAFRVVQGVGIAMVFATGIAILTSVTPPDERGRALGITVAAVYLGLACGPFAGGWLTEHLSWRGVFLANAPLGLGLVLVTLWKLKGEWAGARGEPFDLVGTLVYAAALAALMLGVTRLPAAGAALTAAAGVAGVGVFAWWELRVAHPMFEVRLFTGHRVFAFSCLAALVHYSATFGVTFLMSLYLQYIKGLSPQEAGTVLIAQPVMMALFSPLAGRLSDRMEPRVLSSLGMAITAGALLMLSRVGADTGMGFIILCLTVLGVGFGIFSSPNMNAIMSSVESQHYGVASGAVGTARLLGQMLSLGVATLMFGLLLGRVQVTPEQHPAFIASVHYALLVFFGLCLTGIYFSLSRGQLRKEEGARGQGVKGPSGR